MTQSDCPVSLPDFSTRLTLTYENIPTACSKMSPAERSAAKDKALRAQRDEAHARLNNNKFKADGCFRDVAEWVYGMSQRDILIYSDMSII